MHTDRTIIWGPGLRSLLVSVTAQGQAGTSRSGPGLGPALPSTGPMAPAHHTLTGNTAEERAWAPKQIPRPEILVQRDLTQTLSSQGETWRWPRLWPGGSDAGPRLAGEVQRCPRTGTALAGAGAVACSLLWTGEKCVGFHNWICRKEGGGRS